jgi:hypothetical protein
MILTDVMSIVAQLYQKKNKELIFGANVISLLGIIYTLVSKCPMILSELCQKWRYYVEKSFITFFFSG